MRFVEKEFEPTCPHCEAIIPYFLEVKRKIFGDARQVICCPSCQKVLSINS